MNRIEKVFAEGKKAFIPFVTAGDPDRETTKKLVLAMAANGADIIELGIPFSDPIAEGSVIQEADERALRQGITTDGVFSLVEEIRAETDVPLVFMTYVNVVFTYGKQRFMDRCKAVGMDGIIVPDLPYEEQDELKGECRKSGIPLVSMIAPTSRERIGKVSAAAEGFLYCVSSLGVTGTRKELGNDAESMVREAKRHTSVPCCIGFGISDPIQAARMAAISDGVIVGSAIMAIVAEHGRESVEPVARFVRTMKTAVESLQEEPCTT
jgi:tryptophan synthase alpha chain